MKFDLDKITSQLPPWDLTLSIGGNDYPVRELQIYDLQSLQKGAIEKTDDFVQFVSSLLVNPAADIGTWSLDTLAAAVTQIGNYARERMAENSRIIKSVVAQAATA